MHNVPLRRTLRKLILVQFNRPTTPPGRCDAVLPGFSLRVPLAPVGFHASIIT